MPSLEIHTFRAQFIGCHSFCALNPLCVAVSNIETFDDVMRKCGAAIVCGRLPVDDAAIVVHVAYSDVSGRGRFI